MTKPHTCPTCKGTKSAPNDQGQLRGCPTCGESGVVWEPDGPREAALDGPDDPLELNGL